ncbi:MAG TPA: response regulator [Chloroflexi bacterium]|nr:response regulator [Chloroflexota bacterium]
MAEGRILVIDDDQTILKMFEIALGRAGFEVLSAPDGDIGLRLFRDQKPDLAIIDIAMPGIDGYQVIERIRRLEDEIGHVPLIVLTAHEQSVMRRYAEELGVDLYLTKPVTPSEIVQHIKDLMAGQGA